MEVAVCDDKSFVVSSTSGGGVGDSEGLKMPVCDDESFVVNAVSGGGGSVTQTRTLRRIYRKYC